MILYHGTNQKLVSLDRSHFSHSREAARLTEDRKVAAMYACRKGNATGFIYTFDAGPHEVKRGMDEIGWVLKAESLRPIHEEEVRCSKQAS